MNTIAVSYPCKCGAETTPFTPCPVCESKSVFSMKKEEAKDKALALAVEKCCTRNLL